MSTRPEALQPIPKEAEVAFQGKLFSVLQWDQKLFDGSTTKFEKLRRADTVLVLPVTNDGHLLFGKEQQPGTKPLFRTLGGRIEDGESPEDAARRELKEETGHTADRLHLWDAWHPVNKIDWVVYLFVANGLQRSEASSLDAGERIDLVSVPVDDVFSRNSSIEFDDMEFNLKRFEAISSDAKLEHFYSLIDGKGPV